MEFIAHRINTLKQLKKVPKEYGVEIDLRDYGNKIILNHDPFKDGEEFEDYLKHYEHGTIILNIKSERIELRVLQLLEKYKIRKYIFLDCSFPMVYLLSDQGEKNIALRLSELEGVDTILNMKGRAKWVWIDCFTKFSLNHSKYKTLNKAGFKLCLVSPDLLNRASDIAKHKQLMDQQGIVVNAICTKLINISQWQ